MVKKYREPIQPSPYSVVMDCRHQRILTNKEIHTPAEKRYSRDLYYCNKCANGDRSGTGETGWTNSLQLIAESRGYISVCVIVNWKPL